MSMRRLIFSLALGLSGCATSSSSEAAGPAGDATPASDSAGGDTSTPGELDAALEDTANLDVATPDDTAGSDVAGDVAASEGLDRAARGPDVPPQIRD